MDQKFKKAVKVKNKWVLSGHTRVPSGEGEPQLTIGGHCQAGWHSAEPLGHWAAPTLSLECRRSQEVQRQGASSVPVRAITRLNVVCLRGGQSRSSARHRSATKSTPVRLSVLGCRWVGPRSWSQQPLTKGAKINKMFLHCPVSA